VSWDNENTGGYDAVNLDDALRNYLRQRGLSRTTQLADVVNCWRDVVGDDVAAHVVPWRYDGSDLVLAVDDPAWATEVGFLSESILLRLSQRLQRPAADSVKVHVRPDFNVE
jgi:predicted nucleic acid-binding Zn ribbon protein